MVDRKDFEAAGVDKATLDAMAATGVSFGNIWQIILKILAGLGITIPVPGGASGPTPAHAQAHFAARGVNWIGLIGKLLPVIQELLPIIGGAIGGGAATP